MEKNRMWSVAEEMINKHFRAANPAIKVRVQKADLIEVASIIAGTDKTFPWGGGWKYGVLTREFLLASRKLESSWMRVQMFETLKIMWNVRMRSLAC